PARADVYEWQRRPPGQDRLESGKEIGPLDGLPLTLDDHRAIWTWVAGLIGDGPLPEPLGDLPLGAVLHQTAPHVLFPAQPPRILVVRLLARKKANGLEQ